MSDSLFQRNVEREVQYHARKEIGRQIRNHCSDNGSFTSGATVMPGSILTLAAFSVLFQGNSRSQRR